MKTKGNTVGRVISEVNCAYLAGLIDGDGAIMAFIERHKEKKFGFRIRVSVKISQGNPEILYWVQNLLKIGRVVEEHSAYKWIVRAQSEALSILELLQDYMRIKNRQAKIALQILNSKVDSRQDLFKVAQLADTLSSFNVRSKNRRKNFASMIQEITPRND